MPTEYVPSGPEVQHGNTKVVPMAPIYTCEGCGFVGAPFGVKTHEGVLSYCGYRDGRPVCIGKGKGQAAEPAKLTPPW